MSAELLRKLAQIIEEEAPPVGFSVTGEHLRNIADRIMALACDGEEE